MNQRWNILSLSESIQLYGNSVQYCFGQQPTPLVLLLTWLAAPLPLCWGDSSAAFSAAAAAAFLVACFFWALFLAPPPPPLFFFLLCFSQTWVLGLCGTGESVWWEMQHESSTTQDLIAVELVSTWTIGFGYSLDSSDSQICKSKLADLLKYTCKFNISYIVAVPAAKIQDSNRL